MPNLEGIWDYKKKKFDKLPLPMVTCCLYLYNSFNYLKEKDIFWAKIKSIENNVHISNKFSINNKTNNFSDHPKIGNFSDNPNGNRVDKGVIYFF